MLAKVNALYLRLSMSDGDLGRDNKDESNSIENQRQLLLNYIEDRDDLECDTREYVDDGYTGTNFERPEFQQMMKDVQSGEIACILVKDLSRLGRDYIGVGDYIEQIFPLLGVRFIAVNNNFDSAKFTGATMGLDLAMSNLVNSLYSRDVSKKIRSTFETKWKQGCPTASRVPFGYLWDRTSKQRWVIDPVASKYVRKVFDLALEGKNTTQIAADLNRERIPTPGLYAKMTKKQIAESALIAPDSEMLWKPPIVINTLRRYEYTGALVMRKNKTISLGSRAVRSVKEKDRIITENAHEAIVTHEEFEQAQGAIRTVSPMTYKTEWDYPLKKIVRCGNCNRLLTYGTRHGEGCFVCSSKRAVGSFSKCYNGFYREAIINARVAYAIQNVIRSAYFLQEKLQDRNARRTVQLDIPEPEEKLVSDMEILKAERMRQYEAYADGVIDKTAYLKKKKELTEKIEAIENKIWEVREILRVENEPVDCLREVTEKASAYPQMNRLSQELVQAFVEAVYLDGDSMRIVFKCEDLFQEALEKYFLDSGMTKDEDGSWVYPAENGTNDRDMGVYRRRWRE
ncbi:MAG: recombinase family protein [Clostridiales bacterium]|nr:recombinase family protein [Clostridiales bacterium]